MLVLVGRFSLEQENGTGKRDAVESKLLKQNWHQHLRMVSNEGICITAATSTNSSSSSSSSSVGVAAGSEEC